VKYLLILAAALTLPAAIIITIEKATWIWRYLTLPDTETGTFPDPGTTRWPGLCADPPCDHEENWICVAHTDLMERIGRHRAVWDTPLDDQPGHVIAAVVTDVQNRRQR
jgi:hypothetical protein